MNRLELELRHLALTTAIAINTIIRFSCIEVVKNAMRGGNRKSKKTIEDKNEQWHYLQG